RFHFIGKFHVAPAMREPRRLEVVHAAAEKRALEDRKWEAVARPVRHDHAAAKVAARGMPAQVELTGVAAEARGISVHPGDRAPALIDHGKQITVGFEHVVEIDRDEMRARPDERLRHPGGLRRTTTTPGAAVDED